MKRATITFKDEDMLQGAKDSAQEQGISFSEYVTSLIGLDLQLRLQYKIIAFYDDGSTNEETCFYTDRDLAESVHAYNYILNENEPLPYFEPNKVKLTAFEVWKHGKMITRRERLDNGKEEF